MNTDVRSRPPLNPWWVVVGAGVAVSFGPNMASTTLGLFVLPIGADLGYSQTQVVSGFTFAAIGLAIGVNVIGRLLNFFAVRYIMVPCYALFGICVASLSLANTNPVSFWIPWFILGFVGGGALIPFQKAVLSWFDNRRGLVLGVMAGIYSLGLALLPLLTGWLIAQFGWRTTYVLLGLCTLVVATPIALFLGRVRAERHVRGRLLRETTERGREVSLELPGLTFRQALRSRHFWFLLAALALAGFAFSALQLNLVPIMIARGLDVGEATLLLTVLGLSALVGHVVSGFILDRVRASIVGAVVILAAVGGVLGLYPPFVVAAIAAGWLGLLLGMENNLMPFSVSRYLGMRSFPLLTAVVFSAVLVLQAFGPPLLAGVYEATGTYDAILPILVGILVLAAVIFFALGRYRYPAIEGFDRLASEDELAAAELLSGTADRVDREGGRSGEDRTS
jgi:MFS family permease